MGCTKNILWNKHWIACRLIRLLENVNNNSEVAAVDEENRKWLNIGYGELQDNDIIYSLVY